MVNNLRGKKGWIRIIEAFFAIVIISSFLIFVAVRNSQTSGINDYAYNTGRAILKDISKNESLRNDILVNKTDNINIFVQSRLPLMFNFSTKICSLEDICGLGFYIEKDIYADSFLISGTYDVYSPRQVKLFIWQK